MLTLIDGLHGGKDLKRAYTDGKSPADWHCRCQATWVQSAILSSQHSSSEPWTWQTELKVARSLVGRTPREWANLHLKARRLIKYLSNGSGLWTDDTLDG